MPARIAETRQKRRAGAELPSFYFKGNEVSFEIKTLRVVMRSCARETKAMLPRNWNAECAKYTFV